MTKKIMIPFLIATVILTMVGCSSKADTPTDSLSQEPIVEKNIEEQESSQTRIITDMAGREVTIPVEINKVYSSSPVSTIYLYTLAPEKLAGWNFEPNIVEKEMILSEYHNLPVYGMGDSVNKEAILSDNPDIILVYFVTADDKLQSSISSMEESFNKPVVAIKGGLSDSIQTYEFLGEILGVQQAGKERADYIREMFKIIDSTEIPTESIKTIYYGNGENSLETAPVGSLPAEEMETIGLDNVAKIQGDDISKMQISPEQILAWNPDVIVLNGEPKKDISGNTAVKEFINNPLYSDLDAVKNRQVYGIPQSPFSWMGRPNGPNRLIGVQWLGSIAYPEYYSMDGVVEDFYSLFYHIDLTAEQIDMLQN